MKSPKTLYLNAKSHPQLLSNASEGITLATSPSSLRGTQRPESTKNMSSRRQLTANLITEGAFQSTIQSPSEIEASRTLQVVQEANTESKKPNRFFLAQKPAMASGFRFLSQDISLHQQPSPNKTPINKKQSFSKKIIQLKSAQNLSPEKFLFIKNALTKGPSKPAKFSVGRPLTAGSAASKIHPKPQIDDPFSTVSLKDALLLYHELKRNASTTARSTNYHHSLNKESRIFVQLGTDASATNNNINSIVAASSQLTSDSATKQQLYRQVKADYQECYKHQKESLHSYLQGRKIEKTVMKESQLLDKPIQQLFFDKQEIHKKLKTKRTEERIWQNNTNKNYSPVSIQNKSKALQYLAGQNSGIFKTVVEKIDEDESLKLRAFQSDLVRREKEYFSTLENLQSQVEQLYSFNQNHKFVYIYIYVNCKIKMTQRFEVALKAQNQYRTAHLFQPEYEYAQVEDDLRVDAKRALIIHNQLQERTENARLLSPYQRVLQNAKLAFVRRESKINSQAFSMLFSTKNNQLFKQNPSLQKKARLAFTEGGKKLLLGVAKVIISNNLLGKKYTDQARKAANLQAQQLILQQNELADMRSNINDLDSKKMQAELQPQECKHFLDLVKSDDRDRVQLFLQFNPRLIESVDQLYQTPLHWAAKRGYHEMVELLLRHDAKVAAKDVNGQTAQNIASKYTHHVIAASLQNHEKHQNMKTKSQLPQQGILSILARKSTMLNKTKNSSSSSSSSESDEN